MSYRTFKRVLGETSLERKCRWWFGLSLIVLLSISFTWYGHRTNQLVDHWNRMLGPELVRAGWLEIHLSELSDLEDMPIGDPGSLPEDRSVDVKQYDSSPYRELAASSRKLELGRDFEWYPILPMSKQNVQKLFPPQDAEEERLLEAWSFAPPPQTAPEEEVLSTLELKRGVERSIVIDGRQKYQYYQPLYAKRSCLFCHKALGTVPRPDLREGELMAIARVSIDDPTVQARAANLALLWTAAIVVGFLSMISLWAVVRYVIVKPVTHLRDVANAVRQGDTSQRAVIRTGDEFEELAAAFNRMLRQLLSQQSELRNVNSELDVRLDELAQANMKLYEMNRIKSDFLATVSHELRTPLNSIIGFSDVLSTIDALDEKQLRYVSNIQRSGTVLLDMINDILDLAKIESGKMDVRISEFKINLLIAAQCDMARPLSEKKNIDLVYDAPPDLAPLHQDQAKVQQILNNLLSNAIKFTPEGGRISVNATQDAQGDLRLTVTDTGIGISEEEQTMVFEKFRQSTSALPDGNAMTREYSGTGLGLSIIRELCRLLGGDVTLESALGKGSTFCVRLPWKLEETPRFDAQLHEGLEELTRPSRVESLESRV